MWMGESLLVLPQLGRDDAALPTTMDGHDYADSAVHNRAVVPTGGVDRVAVAVAVADIVVVAAVDIVAVVGIEAVVDDNNTVAARESLGRCCCWEGDNAVVVDPEEATVHAPIHSCVAHDDTANAAATVTVTAEGDIRSPGQRIDRGFESYRVETWTKFCYWPTIAVATRTIGAVVVVFGRRMAVDVTGVFAPVERAPAAGQTHPYRLDEDIHRPIPEDPLHPAVSMPPDPSC
jgi:hypothetical protein